MKFLKLFSQGAVLAVMLSHTTPLMAAEGGDRGGNGGDFMEMKIVTQGYEVLDVLRELRGANQLSVALDLQKFGEILKAVRVVEKPKVELAGLKRSAVNYPKELLLEINPADFDKNKDDVEEFFQMVLHEFMPLIGTLDPGYVHSREIRKRAVALKLIQPRSGKKLTPVLIFQEGLEEDSERMDWINVERDCNVYKQLHAKEYYFVYCVYYEREHQRFVLEPVADTFTTVLRDYWNGREWESNQTYWKSVQRTVSDYSYGLRVFGLGAPGELQWKVVASSLGLADGLIDRLFADERHALQACRQRMISEAQAGSTLIYKARCRTPMRSDGKFYYEIVSQNPLIAN